MKIAGTVTYVNLSGGFWGIQGEDGQQYNPGGSLPKQFQKEGLKVSAEVSPSDAFSIFMWGTNVDIKSIQQK
ncbi:MAG: hypothetical protein AAF206_29615 [Bacteroidota bacterium]